ncbi:ABC transporter ATP-binding protein [Aquibacillus koreensis]|uniref:Nickel import system ATP-binding protein NikD n=1 Tax=Aquibacillus koreensis TaxID=279446 RepID=A0A9X3WPW3_9BACI|nr:ABC transporter ATP-binding protein [Aquibacillus koreensis]MCT2534161.1 ABC transporter ATP-binding protein [Aquibacillus koreensis]MDC3422553.1 ABC transporter ATP-binding protein [Aquibacillus koreensis]
MSILKVDNLSVSFKQYTSGLRQTTQKVISNLSIELVSGEILAIVGASGSGKSLLAHAILGILPVNATTSGDISFDGEVLTPKRQEQLRGKEIALVPQSVNYLDPLMRVGAQVRTSVRKENPKEAQKKVFKRYHLNQEVEKMYPFQLSGGMARRVLVSTAMVSGARVIIADEPTPGLDSVVIEEALNNLREFADQGCAVMLISHDIESALKIADKVAVFYEGTVLEIAEADKFEGNGDRLQHPYSKALWRALPQNDFRTNID